jgi:L-rhamnonate dehydratase
LKPETNVPACHGISSRPYQNDKETIQLTSHKETVMKIQKIEAFPIKQSLYAGEARTAPRRASWVEETEVANPMSRYPRYKRHRNLWRPNWTGAGCLVTAENGTWGLGMGSYSAPVIAVINDHLAPMLKGEDCLAIERLWDMMFRLTSPYSAAGLASYAISAVDLALWDLKGKLLDQPVYALLGGPAREQLFCYATGNDTDWHMELGFKATKLACPYGPADGREGLAKNVELVAKTRELIGDEVELMLDCWMAFDIDYAVRLAERLRPYDVKWMEDCLIPEDFDGFSELRRRIPWMGLATGEHWYTSLPFFSAAARRQVDVLQPDVHWVGGITATVKICHLAEAAGIPVIPHGGMNSPYGQHVCYAMPNIPWGEFFMGSAPGVPLHESVAVPGMAVPQDGYLTPSSGLGFGMDIDKAWLEAVSL